ncbi:MAG: hypothetical protein ACODAQ_04270 [Phycisphaeraceae bacterium]
MAPAHAQSDQPTLDELLELAPTEEEADAREESEIEVDDDSQRALEEAIERELSADDAADAFAQAVQEMDTVAQRLGRGLDAGIETQRMQQRILDKIDQAIAAARQQQQQSGGGGGGGSQQQQQQQQQQDSGGEQLAQQQSGSQDGQNDGEGQSQQAQGDTAHTGGASPGQAGDAEASDRSLRELRREWGSLPPRLRDEISEGMNERFSPVYRSLTEAYYRQLAEEQ